MKQQRETERTVGADRKRMPLGTPIVVSTYNVRTLYQTGKFHQLCCGGIDAGVNIIGVQEHRLDSNDPISEKWSDDKNWLFFHNSTSKDRVGGVGLLVSKDLVKCVSGSKRISDRIISVTFNGNPRVVITVVYAPTESAEDDDKDSFYDDLINHTSNNIKRHDIHIVLGDFNARLGEDSHEASPNIIGSTLMHSLTNNNGERLLDYCLESKLTHAQSHFPQPLSRLWTWKHPTDSVAQLDHILISSKWCNSLRNCRAYNTVELGSDHRIVSAVIKVSLRTTKGKPLDRRKFDWKKLECQDTKDEFKIKLSNRFQHLPLIESITERYDEFEKATYSVANEVLGKKLPTGLPNWVSKETEDLRRLRDTAKRNLVISKSQTSKRRLKDLNSQLNQSYQNDEIKHLQKQLDELTEANNKKEINKVWSIINDISGKKKHLSAKVKKRDGTDPTNQKELLNEWKEYFNLLLNNKSDIATASPAPAESDLPINIDPPTREETVKAIKSLKRNKAAGVDNGITPEALLDGGEAMVTIVHDFCREVYVNKTPPKQWITNLIVPVPKKGDLSQMTNYRGITLMSICAKVYNKLLLNRIHATVDPKLRKNQAGFRPARSCTQQIHILRRIIEGSQIKKLPLVATFIDFRKAFDSINRDSMFAILRSYGIPKEIVDAIRVLYDNSKSAILVDGQLSEEFEVTTGVLQGDVLAPFLFIIVLDFVMKNATKNNPGGGLMTHPRRSKRQPETLLNDLDFADDISLLESNIQRAQLQLSCTVDSAASVGLMINTDKTEYLSINCPANQNLTIGTKFLKKVEDFLYLGSMVASSSADFKRRHGLAWSVFWKLERLWRSQTVPLKLKIDIFNLTCLSVLLYGSETWVISKEIESKLNSFQTRCLRIMLGIKRLDRVTNQQVYQTTSTSPLMRTVTLRQLKFLGHILRMKNNEPVNIYALYLPPHGKRSRGGQRMSFVKSILKKIDPTGVLTAQDIIRDAQSKDGWRRLAVACSAAER